MDPVNEQHADAIVPFLSVPLKSGKAHFFSEPVPASFQWLGLEANDVQGHFFCVIFFNRCDRYSEICITVPYALVPVKTIMHRFLLFLLVCVNVFISKTAIQGCAATE